MTKILNHLMGAAILATLLTAGTALAQERAQADVQTPGARRPIPN